MSTIHAQSLRQLPIPATFLRAKRPSLTDLAARVHAHDERYRVRHVQQTCAIAGAPKDSFPAIFNENKDLQGFYRFVNHTSTRLDTYMQPNFDHTIERMMDFQTVFILLDDSNMKFDNTFPHVARDGVEQTKWTSKLPVNTALAVVPWGKSWRSLGLVAARTWVGGDEREPDDWNAGHRWLEQCQSIQDKVEELLGERAPELVYVADRDSDSYRMLDYLQASGLRFVLRALHTHNTRQTSDGKRLKDQFGEGSGEKEGKERTIEISERLYNRESPTQRKKHPPRKAREVRVQPFTHEFEFNRPENVEEGREQIKVKGVEMREIEPPEGEDAVGWMLWCDEVTLEEFGAWGVIDIYQGRWIIEEFFESFKQLTRMESRQAQSRESLEGVLCYLLAVGHRLFELRWAHRCEPELEASLFFDALELEIIRHKSNGWEEGEAVTVGEALEHLASLGGYIRRRKGPPGAKTIAKGLLKLLNTIEQLHLLRDLQQNSAF